MSQDKPKMSKGYANKLAGQVGEYLVCAELGRRGMIATTFTGNVPEYDLLVCDDQLRSVPIQVKTSRSEKWLSMASNWLNIDIDEKEKRQINRGRKNISNPHLIYVCVSLGKDRSGDRFFVCTKSDIQEVCIRSYKRWMDPKDWKRPRNFKSLDNRYDISLLTQFEDNWALVKQQLDA
jgi:hypothetical protein